ncbi:MAG: DsrE family protein, partial [Burkholderiales bacterium]
MNAARIGSALAAATLVFVTGCASTGGTDAKSNVAPDKVVYHINDSGAQAVNALRNIGNHLEVNPRAKIVVVTHAQGVD